jgi:hypothetical protein
VSDGSSHALVLTKSQPNPSSTPVIQTYRVEKDGNVRIAKTTLQRAGIVGQSYDIDGDTTRVMLRLHKSARPRKSR